MLEIIFVDDKNAPENRTANKKTSSFELKMG